MKRLKRTWDWVQRSILGRSDIYFGALLYMRRWRIGPKWGPGIRLHQIVRGDGDREMHDHPFAFLSLILWGGYFEHRPNPRYCGPVPGSDLSRGAFDATQQSVRRWHGPLSFVFRRAGDLHRLTLDRPAWTLVFRGPIRREWGFLTPRGWVSCRDFTAQREASFGALGEPGEFAAASSLGMARAKESR